MTMHFNVGEAKAQLSKLLDAAVRGEDVVIDRAGKPVARIVPVEEAKQAELNRIAEKRRAFIGSWKEAFEGYSIDIGPSMTDAEVEERFHRKFGPAA